MGAKKIYDAEKRVVLVSFSRGGGEEELFRRFFSIIITSKEGEEPPKKKGQAKLGPQNQEFSYEGKEKPHSRGPWGKKRPNRLQEKERDVKSTRK